MDLEDDIRVSNKVNPDPIISRVNAKDKLLHGGAKENFSGGSRTYSQGYNSGDNAVQEEFCVLNFSLGKRKGYRGW